MLQKIFDMKEGKINMMRVGILGYGNLGKGIECAIKQNDDMESFVALLGEKGYEVKNDELSES